MRFGERHRVGVEVWEWLNGTEYDKTVAVDVFDGTYPAMTLSGGAYLTGDGLAGVGSSTANYASTPDSAALDITGDIEVIVRARLLSWSRVPNLGNGSLVSKRATGQDAYQLYMPTNGNVFEWRFFQGGSQNLVTSNANIPFSAGQAGWVKVTMDVDNGNTQHEIKFYTAADQETEPTSWTQLGTTIVRSGVASIDATTAPLWIGVDNFGSLGASGDYYRVIIRNGIGGTVAFDADFSEPAYGARSFTESSANAATVTIASTANWTANWSKPAGATMVSVLCIGGGGGGGSGRKGAAGTTRGGGSSGGGGGASLCEFEAKELPSTVTVTIGTGGGGGAGVTANSTSGNSGGNGASTTFGSYCGAGGGAGGGGGLDSGGGSFASGGVGLIVGGVGQQRNSGTSPNARSAPTLYTAGGTSGGTISTGNVAGTAALQSAGTGSVMAIVTGVGGQGSAASTTGNSSAGGAGIFGSGGGGSGAVVNDVGNSDAGGNGGDGFCVVVSYRDVDIQEFTASGTWTKPVGDYSIAKIFVVGAGGGGGSGRRGAAGTTRTAGGAGGGGAITCITVPFSQLGATETVTVGLAGTGGAAITVDSTDGNPGTSGGQSSLGTLAVADGGVNGGAGNATTSGSGGLIRNGFSFNGGNGPASQVAGGAGSAGAGLNSYTGGGGSGGGISASNNMAGVGIGGVGAAYTSAITAAQGGSVFGDPGQNGPSVSSVAGFYGGNGGAGGLPNNTGNAGAGGNGSSKGGGGGGGGASLNTYTSGAGGNGGDGYVCVVCI